MPSGSSRPNSTWTASIRSAARSRPSRTAARGRTSARSAAANNGTPPRTAHARGCRTASLDQQDTELVAGARRDRSEIDRSGARDGHDPPALEATVRAVAAHERAARSLVALLPVGAVEVDAVN